jgi:choline-sulfatase
MVERPNILFLMTDEHRATITGYEGDPVIRTPVLDELAESGVVFRNAYTPSPICIPGRQCMASGQLPRTCGVEVYGQDLEPNYMTFARRLSQHAYTTTCVGKLHHDGPDQMQGWTNRPAGDVSITPRYIEDRVEDAEGWRTQRLKWSDAKEIKRAGIGYAPVQMKDDYWTQGALQYIRTYFVSPFYDRPSYDAASYGEAQPLLLKLSLIEPHYPYFTDEAKFNYYLNRVPIYLEGEEVFDHPFLSTRSVIPGEDVDAREIRRATAAYYGMIESADTHFGRVLDALEHVGQNLDDWIIIYTTDHGEMLGEHGIWEKQKFFEGSVRVPLIIRWPERFGGGRVVDENVNLCDLFATLCELTGTPMPEGTDSRSLVPLMEGDAAAWHEKYHNETVSQFRGTNLMIKRDHLKYQHYDDMPEVLFDLERNPAETVSYIDDPDYADAVKAFRVRRAELGFGPDADPNYKNARYHG